MKPLKFFRTLVFGLCFFGLGVPKAHSDDPTPKEDVSEVQGFPSLLEIEQALSTNLAESFPLRSKLEMRKMIERIQRDDSFDPTHAPSLEEGLELQAFFQEFRDSLTQIKAARDENKKRGIVEESEDRSLSLRVFQGFEALSPEILSKKVEEASQLANANLSLTPEEARLLQEELRNLTTSALQITAQMLNDREIRGISSMSASDRFRLHMDADRLQSPSKDVRERMKQEGRKHELDSMLHSEFTGIEKTPIARMVLPHRDEVFMLMDTSFTNPYAPHMLMLIARQLQRAKGGEGRPVVLLMYSPGEGSLPGKLESQVILKPTNLWDSATSTRVAAMMPATKNEVAWSAIYTSYMVLCWYLTKVFINWNEMPRAPMAELHDLLRFTGDLGVFLQKYSTGIESHIFYSAVIGLCYSAYTYLIFDKNVPAWQQTIRHLMLISMPAGLWTIAQVNNWGMHDLFLTEVGLMIVMHTVMNSLINNVSRAFSHSIFSARDGHRVGMGEVPMLGFRFKRQQFYRELLTFPLLFMTKIAHLLKLQPEAWTIRDEAGNVVGYSTPGLSQIPLIGEQLNHFSLGELSFYALPVVTFSVAFAYFTWKDDGVNYANDRRRLVSAAWSFLKAPMVAPYEIGKWGCQKALSAFRQVRRLVLRAEGSASVVSR